MNPREQFEKESGLPVKFRMQRYGGDSNGPEIFNDEYIEWLEQRNAEMTKALLTAHGAFFEDHKFDSSGKGFAVGKVEQALKNNGVDV